ncbi:MAG: NYN domain-containing protein, partial [Clostridia bacterium]
KYLSDLNNLILNNIDKCRELFPEWIRWDYLRELFIIQKGANPEYTKRASFKYINNIKNYPFQCYINWEPGEYGNILHNDSKFVSLLYEIHGDTFWDNTKVRDAGENTKTNIYDFIQDSESTVIIVDCENSDVYKLYSVLKNLKREELDKVKKIILYDDIHTTRAWSLLGKVIDIPVEYNEVQRVNDLKSLVDIKMTAGTCREFYSNGIKSFILASSDSDFWGLISSLPDAEFLVLMEYEKCGRDIKEALEERNIYYCAMDDFCTGNIKDLKDLALIIELEDRLKNSINLNANTLLSDIYRDCRITASETEKQSFYNRYLKTLSLQLDENGDFHLAIKRK